MQGTSGGFDTGGEDMNPEPIEAPPAKKHKNLYDSFVTAREREERGDAFDAFDPPVDLLKLAKSLSLLFLFLFKPDMVRLG